MAFSPDGKYVTTGSSDNSIKVLEVSKMKKDVGDEKPVIKTLYGHTDVSLATPGMFLEGLTNNSHSVTGHQRPRLPPERGDSRLFFEGVLHPTL